MELAEAFSGLKTRQLSLKLPRLERLTPSFVWTSGSSVTRLRCLNPASFSAVILGGLHSPGEDGGAGGSAAEVESEASRVWAVCRGKSERAMPHCYFQRAERAGI